MVDSRGELKDAEEVYIPTTAAPKPVVRSAWTKGLPASIKVKTVVIPSPDSDSSETQEVELAFPTPSHAHLMPPISAWTMYSTDSDPAGPWDPAVQHREHDTQNSVQAGQAGKAGKGRPQELDYQGLGDVGPMYPWGMPMTPVSAAGQEQHQQHQQHYPGGAGVLWTPSGWAVQDIAMKRAMAFAESAAQMHRGRKNRTAVKNYYKSEPTSLVAIRYQRLMR